MTDRYTLPAAAARWGVPYTTLVAAWKAGRLTVEALGPRAQVVTNEEMERFVQTWRPRKDKTMETINTRRTFRYAAEAEPSFTDLRHEWEQAGGQTYAVTIFDADGKAEGMGAEALLVPGAGRVGFASGADADWMDSTGDIERDIDIWLNDPEEFEARN